MFLFLELSCFLLFSNAQFISNFTEITTQYPVEIVKNQCTYNNLYDKIYCIGGEAAHNTNNFTNSTFSFDTKKIKRTKTYLRLLSTITFVSF